MRSPDGAGRKERAMKVLVTAGSKYGSTREIAEAIGEVLTERGLDIAVVPPEEVDSVDAYDAVVLGSAVYAGRWQQDVKELMDRVGDGLRGRPVWLFSSGPIGNPPKPEEDPVDAAEMMERSQAREHRVFAGKLVKQQLSFPEKAIVIALRAPEGDFRDWDAVRSWASGIADTLQAA
jgi:menaquinone-dependent protoporphyrinogen oxidase